MTELGDRVAERVRNRERVDELAKASFLGHAGKRQSLGDRLILARANARLSQTELAQRSGIASTQISRYEGGRCVPRRAALHRLAAALGVTVDWLCQNEVDQRAASSVSVRINMDLADVPTSALLEEIARRCK